MRTSLAVACVAVARAFVGPARLAPRRRTDARPFRFAAPSESEAECATVDECEVEAEAARAAATLLGLQAEKMKLEAQKEELLLQRQKLERARAKAAEEEAAPAAAPAAEAAAEAAAEVVPRASTATKAVEASAADCETEDECLTEAEMLRLEAEKLRLEAQKAELLLAREKKAAQQLEEAAVLAAETLEAAVEAKEADDDDAAAAADVFGAVDDEVDRRYPERAVDRQMGERSRETVTSEALLGLFPEAALTMTPEAAEAIKAAAFGLDSFAVSRVDACAAGAIFRGNVRTKTAAEALDVAAAALEKAAPLKGRWRLFVIEDPVAPTDDEIDERMAEARAAAVAGRDMRLGADDPDNELMLAAKRPTVFVVVDAATKPLNVGAVGGLAARVVGLSATAFSASAFAVSTGALDDTLYDRLVAADPAALEVVAPVGVCVGFVLLAHEVGHFAAAKVRSVKLSSPLFLPSLSTGALGACNDLDDYPRRKADLYDVALAGPVAGLVCSVALLALGGALTGAAAAGAPLPALPAASVRSSLVGSLVLAASSPALAAALGNADVTVLALHPMAVAGLAGLAVNALALLPLGRTDGGRAALASYGRSLAGAAAALATVVAGVVGVAGPNDLLLFHLLYVFTLQRDLEIPCVDEVSDVGANKRNVYAAFLFFAILCLLPSPVKPVVDATLSGFPTL